MVKPALRRSAPLLFAVQLALEGELRSCSPRYLLCQRQ